MSNFVIILLIILSVYLVVVLAYFTHCYVNIFIDFNKKYHKKKQKTLLTKEQNEAQLAREQALQKLITILIQINLKKEKAEVEFERLEKERLAREMLEKERLEKEIENAKLFVANGALLKRLKELDRIYKFNRYSLIELDIECDTRQQYDSPYFLDTYFKNKLVKYPTMFDNYFKKAEENISLYINWKKDYNECRNLFCTEKTAKLAGVNFNIIHSLENDIYKQKLKPKPQCKKIIKCNISYSTSNFYHNKTEYVTEEKIKALLEEIKIEKIRYKEKYYNERIKEELDIQKERQDIEKSRLNIEKEKEENRHKEEIHKIKEEELKRKTQEFYAATKGYIYSTNQTTNNAYSNNEINNNVNSDTPKTELEKLREAFTNGEIDFEEYQEKRNNLF